MDSEIRPYLHCGLERRKWSATEGKRIKAYIASWNPDFWITLNANIDVGILPLESGPSFLRGAKVALLNNLVGCIKVVRSIASNFRLCSPSSFWACAPAVVIIGHSPRFSLSPNPNISTCVSRCHGHTELCHGAYSHVSN